ncbi:MAG TPA: hypothetical protein VG125_21715 [Pirellulales bacterium]|jgi:hypothetical protein|nr:hypothetical protein [Pirellulales bacterium]
MNVTDQYAYGYRYLANVFQGSLQPANTSLARQTAVSYRKVATSKANVDWAASIGLTPEYQTFELWTITLAAGYVPGINDVWTDKDSVAWNTIKVDADPLVNSVGVPTRFFLLAQRAK